MKLYIYMCICQYLSYKSKINMCLQWTILPFSCLVIVGFCQLKTYLQRNIDHQGKLKCNLKPEKKFL